MSMPRAAAAPSHVVLHRRPLPLVVAAILSILLALLFVTASTASAVDVCTTDSAGANDEPNQKDLSKLCIDDGGLPGFLAVRWHWDDTGWPGANTGDACSLFDTDNDGNANYSLCITVANDTATFQSRQLYHCGADSRPDKCMGAATAATTSVCTAEVLGTHADPADPFPDGDDYPQDTVGSCTINMADLGGAAAKLIDVCSYPSREPNSDPSDCVYYRNKTGRLEVRKVVTPAYNPGRFNLLIDNTIEASNVSNGGTTGEKVVSAGNHTVSETGAGTTSVSDYNTTIECRDNNGTGQVVLSARNAAPRTVNVPDGSDIVCVITNERQTGAIRVNKIVHWNGITPDPQQTFEVCIVGPSYPQGNCKTTGFDGGWLVWEGIETGLYYITETDPGSAWSVEVGASPVRIPCGATVYTTVTNTRKLGELEVTKVVDWNDIPIDPTRKFEICVTGPSFATKSCQETGPNGGVLTWSNLIPGIYQIVETDPGSAWSVSVTGSPAKVPVDGSKVRAQVANTLKRGSLTITKLIDWNGSDPDAAQSFDICITGPSFAQPNCQRIGYEGGGLSWTDLLPGLYTVTESDAGRTWTTRIEGSPAEVVSGDSGASATVFNTRKRGSLTVTKTVDWRGVEEDLKAKFQVCISGPSYPLRDCREVPSGGGELTWENLIPGQYTVSELDPGSSWTVSVPDAPVTVPADGGHGTAEVRNVHKLGNLSVEKIVNWNGSDSDEGQQFTICITGPSYPTESCQITGFSGGLLTWTDLLPGEYVVTEKGVGAEWLTTIAGTPAIVAGDGSTTKASVTNTRKRGSIMVTKVVDWKGITPDESQTFRICVTGPSFPQGDCQAAGYLGGPIMWHDLIPGNYTVSEAALGSEWMVTIDDTDVTVLPDGTTATTSVVNVRKLGILDVVKVVDWHGITPDEGQEFRVCISGPSFPTGDCKTADYDGSTLTWDSLIPGVYTLYEENPGAAWTVTVDAATFFVPGNGMVTTAGITNTRKRGSLTVNKVADWNGIEPDKAKTFLICITGPSFPAGDCKTTDFDGGALLWEDLIPGSYTVSEQNPGAEWNVQVKNSPAVVPVDGSSAAASVLNTRKLGSLQVTKTVNWNGLPPDKGQSFTICIAGPSFTNSDCKTIGFNGGKLTWDDLIPGVYEVTENSPGSTWTVLISGSPATVPVTGGRAEVTVANTKQPPASITLTKVVTKTSKLDWRFVFQLDGDHARTVTKAQPTATWDNLESGHSYVLSEANPGIPWQPGDFKCTVNELPIGAMRRDKSIRLTVQSGDHVVCVKYNADVGGTDDLAPEQEPGAGFHLYLPKVNR